MSQHLKQKWKLGNSITRQELEQAMEVYLKNGGKIKILKPEYARSTQVIGHQEWESYLSFDEITDSLN